MRTAKRLARRKSGERSPVIAWMHRWIFPPALWDIALRFERYDRATNKALSLPPDPTPLSEMMFHPLRRKPNWVPVEKIVNRMGQSFTTEQHHFVRYLESGFGDFKHFYRIHQPKTALQAHFIDETLPGPAGTGVSDVPWQPAPLTDPHTRTRPDAFGPVSVLEIATEAARLERVQHSIKKYGFLAGHAGDAGGSINGQIFYKNNDDFRFVISGGNHRTAVLAHLGWKLIHVHQVAGFHPVRLGDLAQWPGVVDGRFKEETARAMFEAFFRPGHQKLLPDW